MTRPWMDEPQLSWSWWWCWVSSWLPNLSSIGSYDPLVDWWTPNWVDDDDDDDGLYLGDLTCHPLGVPLWLSHWWMNSNWVPDVALVGFHLILWKNRSSMKLNSVDDVGFHLHKLLNPIIHWNVIATQSLWMKPNLSWMMLLGFTLAI
jgi:hypothetical protein